MWKKGVGVDGGEVRYNILAFEVYVRTESLKRLVLNKAYLIME